MVKFYRIQRSNDFVGPYSFDINRDYNSIEIEDMYNALWLNQLMKCPDPRKNGELTSQLKMRGFELQEGHFGFTSLEAFKTWFDVDMSQYTSVDYYLYIYEVPEEYIADGINQAVILSSYFKTIVRNYESRLDPHTMQEA
jgi:hypothetical protein